MKLSRSLEALLLATAAKSVSAVELNVQDPGSIKAAASTIAYGLVKYYTGNVTNTPETIAILPPPHYWWQAGAMWGLLLDYYHFTGDAAYNAITTQALLSQVGPKNDYMVPLYALSEANDDQAFWGFSTMSAAEKGYPEPTTGGYTWLQLTENLWNTQVYRWDMTTCGGGLKWQIFDFNKGFFYKNSVSNGAFFQLSARLARFTGNQTYLDWAVKSWEWSESVGLISPDHHIFDGTDSLKNCADLNHIEWSYNLGIYLYGAAMLFDATNGAKVWADRTQGLLDASAFFFSPFDNATDIMYEYACEPIHTCNYDQFSFKGYLARFMWATTVVAPFTKDTVTKLLTTSAKAAAKSCSGGRDGVTCGTKWYTGAWDGTFGVGQQMSALEAIQGLLIQNSPPPQRASNARKQEPSTTSSVSTTPQPSTTVSSETPVETSKATESPKGQSTTIPSVKSVPSPSSVQPTFVEISLESSISGKLLGPTNSLSSDPTSVVVAPSSLSAKPTSVVLPSLLSETPMSPLPSSSSEDPMSSVVLPSPSSEESTSSIVTPIPSSATLTSFAATPTSIEKPFIAETPSSTAENLTTAEPLPTPEEPKPEPVITSTEEPPTSTSTSTSTPSIISTTPAAQETPKSEEPTSPAASPSSSHTTTFLSSSVTSSLASSFVTSSTSAESSKAALTTTSTTGETPVPSRAPAESQTRVAASPTPSPSAPGSAGTNERVSWGMGMSFMIACLSALYFS